MKQHAEFATHRLNDGGMVKAKMISDQFNNLMNELEANCLPCREMAIVRTKLEEACFFAKKAMAINLINQDY